MMGNINPAFLCKFSLYSSAERTNLPSFVTQTLRGCSGSFTPAPNPFTHRQSSNKNIIYNEMCKGLLQRSLCQWCTWGCAGWVLGFFGVLFFGGDQLISFLNLSFYPPGHFCLVHLTAAPWQAHFCAHSPAQTIPWGLTWSFNLAKNTKRLSEFSLFTFTSLTAQKFLDMLFCQPTS